MALPTGLVFNVSPNLNQRNHIFAELSSTVPCARWHAASFGSLVPTCMELVDWMPLTAPSILDCQYYFLIRCHPPIRNSANPLGRHSGRPLSACHGLPFHPVHFTNSYRGVQSFLSIMLLEDASDPAVCQISICRIHDAVIKYHTTHPVTCIIVTSQITPDMASSCTTSM